MSSRQELVPGNRAIWQPDTAKTYRCPTCQGPIFSQNTNDVVPAIECVGDGAHRLTWQTYTCESCAQTFDKATPDEKVNAEAKALFGVEAASERDDMAIVCDDCFKAMQAHFGW